jgi:hypothetical protein
MGGQAQTKKILLAELPLRFNRSVTKISIIRRFSSSPLLRLQRRREKNKNNGVSERGIWQRCPLFDIRIERVLGRERYLHNC